jgi:branched-chain amino acid transport system substrate-binding protein
MFFSCSPRLGLVMAIPLLALSLSGAHAEPGVSAKQLLIGQSITLQAGKNDYGMAVQDGISAYLQTVNAKGGVLGRQVQLKTLDDDNKPAQAEANARTLVEQDKVFLLFGSIEGGPSTAVMKAAVDLAVPFFGPMAGSPTLRRPYQPMVFPVRAEHREEFKALMQYSKNTGGSKVAFVRSDSETGLQHLANVKLLCQELGMELVADLPFKSDISDTQLDAMVTRLQGAGAHVVINHGGSGMYEKLIRKAKTAGVRSAFSAVNSGSAQLAKHLGPLAHGMVFAQVVPSPWERKTAITREYQDVFSKFKPDSDFSYGSLEGYITAKALVAALQLAGTEPTRERFVKALHTAGSLDLNGLRATYTPTLHTGLGLVDLSIVNSQGKFRH